MGTMMRNPLPKMEARGVALASRRCLRVLVSVCDRSKGLAIAALTVSCVALASTCMSGCPHSLVGGRSVKTDDQGGNCQNLQGRNEQRVACLKRVTSSHN